MGRKGLGLLMLAGLAAVAFGLGGCAGFSRAVGTAKNIPDEFEVVTKAPLVIPPDFSLRPPAPGQARGPQTEGELIAQRAMLGENQAFTPGMSPGERALVAAAGATHADPLIRQVVDQDYANLITRGDDFAERLIFWDKRNAAAGRGADAVQQASQKPNSGPADEVEGQQAPTIKKKKSGPFGGIF
jgi:hypothetical protein